MKLEYHSHQRLAICSVPQQHDAKAGMKRIILLIPLVALILVAVKLAFDMWENSEYYEYHDLAIAACKSGDMEKAYKYIDIAIQHARDSDLVSEGRHDRLLFDHNACSE